MIDDFIKILCFDKFIVFRDVFEVEAILYYLFKIIWIVSLLLFSARNFRGAILLILTLRMIDRVIDRNRNYSQNLNISSDVLKFCYVHYIKSWFIVIAIIITNFANFFSKDLYLYTIQIWDLRRHLKGRYRRLFVNCFEYFHKIIIILISLRIYIYTFKNIYSYLLRSSYSYSQTLLSLLLS